MKISEQIKTIIDSPELNELRNDHTKIIEGLELSGNLTRAYNKACKIEDPDYKELKNYNAHDFCDCDISED